MMEVSSAADPHRNHSSLQIYSAACNKPTSDENALMMLSGPPGSHATSTTPLKVNEEENGGLMGAEAVNTTPAQSKSASFLPKNTAARGDESQKTALMVGRGNNSRAVA